MREREEDAPEAGLHPAKGATSARFHTKRLKGEDTPPNGHRLRLVRCRTAIARGALP